MSTEGTNTVINRLGHISVELDGLAETLKEERHHQPEVSREGPALELGWREKLWVVPAETRLGVVEVAEALGRSKSWVYKRSGPKAARTRLPCRKLDGELSFLVGELRTWVRQHEVVEHAVPMTSTPMERRLYLEDAA
ncbi:hypothetical protein ACFL0I_05580 [Gemmatimonadota bacterium]